jgi:N-acetylglucosamine-6-phosphate deacetylase
VNSTAGDLLLRGARALTGEPEASLLIADGRIAAVGDDANRQPSARAARVVDCRGLLLAPGFIDLQVNGAAGFDVTSDPASLWRVAEALPRFGVTAFLPTVITSAEGTVERAVAILADGAPAGFCGATPLGLHVEGPYLSPERRGVHDESLLRTPDTGAGVGWTRDAGVRLVTLAPELPGALDLVRRLVADGVVVSVGHTAASFDEAHAAVDAGATYATHLFNGMPPLHHRSPGAVAALLLDERVTVGVIADGVHVHPAMVDLAWRVAGPRRFSAVTDAVASMGATAGQYPLGAASLDAASHDAARVGDRLAGGTQDLATIVRNVLAFTGASPADAVATVTTVPSRLLGLPAPALAVGSAADLVLLTTELRVAATIVGGRLAWSDPELRPWP